MKVTTILPDDLVKDIRNITKGKTLTESLIKALSEWISMQKIRNLNSKIEMHPLKFRSDFKAQKARELNRT